jgi:membrane associated rhomboid family serine protease
MSTNAHSRGHAGRGASRASDSPRPPIVVARLAPVQEPGDHLVPSRRGRLWSTRTRPLTRMEEPHCPQQSRPRPSIWRATIQTPYPTSPWGRTTGAAKSESMNAPPSRHPWVTIAACVMMIVVFIGVNVDSNASSPGALTRWGYLDAFGIWTGGIWALLTSAFVHQSIWHVGLNVYWTWILGSVIEPVIGWSKMLLLVATSAFVSSAVQLAGFEDTGIGASGMVYALFGFGWLARKKFAGYQSVFSTRTAVLFLTWLVACWIILTREIGNGAHIGGLVFGAVVAEAFVTGRWPRLARVATVLILIGSAAVSVVCPWSGLWWSSMGYRVHMLGEYSLAAEAYQASLDIAPDQPWVLSNLIRAHLSAGNRNAAGSALERLRKVAPADAETVEKEFKEVAEDTKAQP